MTINMQGNQTVFTSHGNTAIYLMVRESSILCVLANLKHQTVAFHNVLLDFLLNNAAKQCT